MQIHNIDNTQKVSMARINPENTLKVYKYISLIVLISKNNFGSWLYVTNYTWEEIK